MIYGIFLTLSIFFFFIKKHLVSLTLTFRRILHQKIHISFTELNLIVNVIFY